jgi:EPS-associated MarR family transcriptional regulator
MNAPLNLSRLHEVTGSASGTESAILLTAMRMLSTNPHLSQRQLSLALGLSLGKTNYVLRALLDKGLLKVRNFRRNSKKSSYMYLLTPKGMKEKVEMTRMFLFTKETEFETLQTVIEQLRLEVQQQQTPNRKGRAAQ